MNAHNFSDNDLPADVIYFDFAHGRRCSEPRPAQVGADILSEIASFISASTGCSETVAGDVLEVLLETFGLDQSEVSRND
ncbi:MAG: hypothetical protein KME20_27025 [Kaiparowitsia implicata GSE-PSE-MK54-09C]|nr:hypothetical protein [Kaiparowitsia implicata GSE-PSE-MK54-09C]